MRLRSGVVATQQSRCAFGCCFMPLFLRPPRASLEDALSNFPPSEAAHATYEVTLGLVVPVLRRHAFWRGLVERRLAPIRTMFAAHLSFLAATRVCDLIVRARDQFQEREEKHKRSGRVPVASRRHLECRSRATSEETANPRNGHSFHCRDCEAMRRFASTSSGLTRWRAVSTPNRRRPVPASGSSWFSGNG